MTNPRYANGHRRRSLRRRVLTEETDCWLCLQPVDKTLPPLLPGSPELDEIVPVSLGGDPLARTNVRLAHRGCNVRRGNGTRSKKMIVPISTSRDWGGGTTLPPGTHGATSA